MAVGVEPYHYPRKFLVVDGLGTVAVTIFAAGRCNPFSHMVLRNASATTRTYTFRGVGSGPTVMSVVLSPTNGHTMVIPGWCVDTNGLEIVSSSATGAQSLTVFYTAGPLGAS